MYSRAITNKSVRIQKQNLLIEFLQNNVKNVKKFCKNKIFFTFFDIIMDVKVNQSFIFKNVNVMYDYMD